MSLARWTPEQIEASVATGRPVLVDMRADWCTRCAAQEGVLERLIPEYEDAISIGSLDVGEFPDFSDGYGIKSVPSFLYFNDGAHRMTVVGFKRAPQLREDIGKVLAGRSDG